MHRYLVTAVGWRESPDNPGSYHSRTFSFEVKLDTPWNGRNSEPVCQLAFHECHRTFGFWPRNNPDIKSVVEIGPASHTKALLEIYNMVVGAEQADVWDHLSISDFIGLMPWGLADDNGEPITDVKSDEEYDQQVLALTEQTLRLVDDNSEEYEDELI